jgi:hypothetical protein
VVNCEFHIKTVDIQDKNILLEVFDLSCIVGMMFCRFYKYLWPIESNRVSREDNLLKDLQDQAIEEDLHGKEDTMLPFQFEIWTDNQNRRHDHKEVYKNATEMIFCYFYIPNSIGEVDNHWKS